MLFCSTIAKSKKAFESILVIIVTLAATAYTPILMNQMEKYSGREDIDVLDLLRLEFTPFEKYVLPICVVLLAASILLCWFVGSRLLGRRQG